tara:strand:- start:3281 stop:5521 length:2241 start_codon:yes stop_codon:yes gene_type:complete
MYRLFLKIIFISSILINSSFAEIIKEIKILGNERITSDTIKIFTTVKTNDDIDENKVNFILKELYETGFFKNVNVEFENNILEINVVENPIIQEIKYEGIKAQKIRNVVLSDLKLKSRSSFNEIFLEQDKNSIISSLRSLGYYFSKVEVFINDLNDNRIDVTYQIELGEKAKIKKISFIGNKIYKDKKLKRTIISEEYKFWKFISGKKFLNENILIMDNRLLKNFYLNKGYYGVKINSSFAKLINEDEFELIFNIDAGEKFYFGNLDVKLPVDYNKENFEKLFTTLDKLEDEPYSINGLENILEKIEINALNEQYESINVDVVENLDSNKINLTFQIQEPEKKFFIERFNILGNNVTQESVMRNQFEIDEGDPYNEILVNKTVNNIQNLNFFKSVKSEVKTGSSEELRIIDIMVEEKPTGEISASAGVGTAGSSIGAGIRENNFLGRGISLISNLTLSEDSIKGIFSVVNPNFRNTDKSIYTTLEALENDKLKDFGYKTNRTGLALGTNFEYFDDVRLGLGTSNYFEKIETDSSASTRMKKQEGNYFDSFLKLDVDYDKRNQKFQTSDGFRSYYSVDLPLVSDTNTLKNEYNYKFFTELYENNVTTAAIYLSAVNSITNDDVKLSERLYIPSRRLRGFISGRVGPKDGNDYIGGNYTSVLNLTTTLPQILENSQTTDFAIFMDVANIWGVDYDSSIDDGNKIRSSVGFGVDWFTPIGPLNFSLAAPISKATTDETETFRFNLGTTF